MDFSIFHLLMNIIEILIKIAVGPIILKEQNSKKKIIPEKF